MEVTLLGTLYVLAYSLIVLLIYIVIYKRLQHLLEKQIAHTGIDLLRLMYSKTIRIVFISLILMVIGSVIIILTFI